MNRRLVSATLAWALGFGAFADPRSLSAAEAVGDAERVLDHVTQSVGTIKRVFTSGAASSVTPEERIAAGEILLRNRDWERAIQTFSQVKELHSQGKVAEPALVDAEYLLGEAYFRSNQYLSARREYLDIAQHGARAPYDIYAGRSLSRLVDISLRMEQPSKLAELDNLIPGLPAADASGSLAYAKAKYFYAKGDYAKAREAVSQVGTTSAYLHQSLYLQGVVLTKEARAALQSSNRTEREPKTEQTTVSSTRAYSAAIEQFKAVTRLPADTADRRHVIDLAWMAIARLHYESNNMLDAVDAYSRIGRESPEFSTMLFELAWVYAQLGDYQRAQRSLEVLSITDPQKLELSDGSLLRADLMLRSGQFDKALALYQGVRDRFEPMRSEVDQYIHANSDPSVYYDQLVSDVPDANQGQVSKLSPVVVTWVREEADNNRTLTVIDDVARSRDLVKRSRKLITQVTALLASPTRANAFPEIRSSTESALAAVNRISSARLILARGLDAVAQERVPAELAKVRRDRRALMKRIGQLPVLPADFMRRVAAAESRWNGLSQQLQRLTLEVDKLHAIINGLNRVMRESDTVQVDPAARQRFLSEIRANEQDLAGYRERINGYRDAVDMGRVQTGLGDAQYSEDDRARRAFKELLAREMEMVSRGGADSPDATALSRSAQPVLTRAAAVDEELEAILRGLEAEVAKRAAKLQGTITHESEAIEQNARQLEDLDQQARLLVGEVAMRNFAQVRDRLKGVVLRADVGIVQQAWEVREEQRTRVVNLQRERAREEQNLNDELREVLDDAEGAL